MLKRNKLSENDVDLRTLCRMAMEQYKLSQNALATRLGLTKSNLSSALHGRRPLPADAAIELAELVGLSAKEVRMLGKSEPTRIERRHAERRNVPRPGYNDRRMPWQAFITC